MLDYFEKKSGEIENVIELIQGTIKELDKLAQYKDKNVYDPNFILTGKQESRINRNRMHWNTQIMVQNKVRSRKVECVVT